MSRDNNNMNMTRKQMEDLASGEAGPPETTEADEEPEDIESQVDDKEEYVWPPKSLQGSPWSNTD